MADTEHVIEVLTENVAGEHLDHLRAMKVSYIFGGKISLDLALILEKLRNLFGINRVRVDGGGMAAFVICSIILFDNPGLGRQVALPVGSSSRPLHGLRPRRAEDL